MATSPPNPITSGDMFQNSLYIGTNIQNILFGMELLLYFKTIRIILFNKKARRKCDAYYAVFSTVMVFCLTLWVATQAYIGQEMWILNPDFPGGPVGFWEVHVSDWYMDWATTGVILLQLMTDALMIYRCRIVLRSYLAIVIPIILWLATFALGILVDWSSSIPGGDFFTGIACRLGMGYYSTSVFLNTTLTGMICYRILRHSWSIQEHLGRKHASLYFKIITTVIESVLPYTVSGIAFLVAYGLKSSTAVAFISVYVPMMCISPQMLILRVIAGRAWDNNASRPHSSVIQFGQIQSLDDAMSRVQLEMPPNVYCPDGHDKV